MISRRETISVFARGAIVDGDDIHKTEDDEEDFSTIGNTSRSSRNMLAISEEMESTAEYPETSDKDIQSSQKARVRNFLHRLGQKSKLLPKKLYQQSNIIFRPTINAVAEYQEMEENEDESKTIVTIRSTRIDVGTGRSMLVKQNAQVVNRPSSAEGTWDAPKLDSFDDSNSRRNLGLREKSLILDDGSLGGMSDITEDTFFFGSKMDHLASKRSPMFAKNPTTYRIEEIEEEEKRENNSEKIGINSASDVVIERAYDFRKLSPLNDNMECGRGYDLRATIHNPIDAEREFSLLFIDDRPRRRSFSDSRIDFDRRGDISTENSVMNNLFPLSPSSNLSNEEQFESLLDQLKLSSHDRSFTDSYETPEFFEEAPEVETGSTHSIHRTTIDSWPFPRTRSYSSGPRLQQTRKSDELAEFPLPNRSSHSMFAKDEEKYFPDVKSSRYSVSTRIPSQHEISHQASLPKRSSHSMFEREDKHFPDVRRRSTTKKSLQKEPIEILWNPQTPSLLDLNETPNSNEVPFESFGFDRSGIESQPQRTASAPIIGQRNATGTSTKTIGDETIHPRLQTNSVLATLSDSNNGSAGTFLAKDNGMPLQEPLVRNPPSKIVNAASLTVAALRPAPTQSLPALPTQKESDQYYWGNIHEDDLCSEDNHRKNGESDSEELKDLCSWSSESYDDIL